jgi:Holliday junction resolvasome RuvABC endonuclease subunit
MIVLGIDGGLAHLGWAVAQKASDFHRAEVIDGGVIETLPREEGTRADSHAARALELHKQLVDIVEKHRPDEICAEAFSPPRDSRNASMLAWSWGVICAVASTYGISVQTKSPMPLKHALAGDRCAKKPAMIAAAQATYPESRKLFPRRADLHEHFADAIAAIHFFYGEARA